MASLNLPDLARLTNDPIQHNPTWPHYFLGMEVWQNADGIFLRQGKYAVEILKRFGMMECKAITTPMELNLKLLSDASSEVVDAKMYHQMNRSLMY